MSFDKVNQTHTPCIKDNCNMKASINMEMCGCFLVLTSDLLFTVQLNPYCVLLTSYSECFLVDAYYLSLTTYYLLRTRFTKVELKNSPVKSAEAGNTLPAQAVSSGEQ